jgi:hypothetical protein
MTDFSRDEGQERFERFLESSGITAELERLGIEDGDIVHIGNHELVWGDQYDYEEATPRRSGKGARARSSSD